MPTLDGNALAGAFARLVAPEVSGARLRCAGCGAVDAAAEAVLETSAMGAVARCRRCGVVLLTVVDDGERMWLGMPGVRAIGLPRNG